MRVEFTAKSGNTAIALLRQSSKNLAFECTWKGSPSAADIAELDAVLLQRVGPETIASVTSQNNDDLSPEDRAALIQRFLRDGPAGLGLPK